VSQGPILSPWQEQRSEIRSILARNDVPLRIFEGVTPAKATQSPILQRSCQKTVSDLTSSLRQARKSRMRRAIGSHLPTSNESSTRSTGDVSTLQPTNSSRSANRCFDSRLLIRFVVSAQWWSLWKDSVAFGHHDEDQAQGRGQVRAAPAVPRLAVPRRARRNPL